MVLILLGDVRDRSAWSCRARSFGRYAYAIGSNAKAAKLAGVPVARWRIAFYVICGGLAAVAGLVFVSRTGNRPAERRARHRARRDHRRHPRRHQPQGRPRPARRARSSACCCSACVNNGLILAQRAGLLAAGREGRDPADRRALRRAAPQPAGGSMSARGSGSSAAAGGRRGPTCRRSRPIPDAGSRPSPIPDEAKRRAAAERFGVARRVFAERRRDAGRAAELDGVIVAAPHRFHCAAGPGRARARRCTCWSRSR